MDEVDHGIGATNRVGDRFGIKKITAAPLDAVIIKFAVRGVRWPPGERDQIESRGQLLEQSTANESAGASDRDPEPRFLGIWQEISMWALVRGQDPRRRHLGGLESP